MNLNALNGSINSSVSSSQNSSQSYAANAAAEANAWSAEQARIAHERQKELLQMSMDFNREQAELTRQYNAAEAEKARTWEQGNINIANEMANTVYTRSVKDLIAAGINPILAAGAGLGAAGSGTVASGAGASASAASVGVPSTYMGQTTAQYNSASTSQGSSHGSSSGESGLATGLALMGSAIAGAISKLNASNTINVALDGLKDLFKDDGKTIIKKVEESSEKDQEDYSNKNTTGKDRHGNTVRHISSDTNPEPGSFTYGLEQYLRAHGLL